jgi:hypothetical protein
MQNKAPDYGRGQLDTGFNQHPLPDLLPVDNKNSPPPWGKKCAVCKRNRPSEKTRQHKQDAQGA